MTTNLVRCAGRAGIAPILPLAVLLIALAGCGRSDPVPAPDAAASAAATPAVALPIAAPSSSSPREMASIPAKLQGRWGLVGPDCTGDPAAAKGLMTVRATDLKFYESRGVLGSVVASGAAGLRAHYAFSGEGMTWTREIDLSLVGDRLVRRDADGEMKGQTLSYTRCPAG
jgi:predicted small lipoprotein YifL